MTLASPVEVTQTAEADYHSVHRLLENVLLIVVIIMYARFV